MPGSASNRLTEWVAFCGVGLVFVAVAVHAIGANAREVAAVAGVGGLLMMIGFGLRISCTAPGIKQRAGVSAGETGEFDFRLLQLAHELRRPLFRWHEIIVIVCGVAAPLIMAGAFKTLWPLVGLVFPAALVITVALATLGRRYRAVKRAFIEQLPAAKRKEFLDVLQKQESKAVSPQC